MASKGRSFTRIIHPRIAPAIDRAHSRSLRFTPNLKLASTASPAMINPPASPGALPLQIPNGAVPRRTTAPKDSDRVKAVVYGESSGIYKIPGKGAKEKARRDRLNHMNNTGSLDGHVYGNDAGRSLLEDLDRMRGEIKSLKDGLAEERRSLKDGLAEERRSRKKETGSLETQIGAMSFGFGGLQVDATTIALRNRFFYNFGKKILKRKLKKAKTKGGNRVAHEGNLALDMVVLGKRPPRDRALPALFKELYGVTYRQAKTITGRCIS